VPQNRLGGAGLTSNAWMACVEYRCTASLLPIPLILLTRAARTIVRLFFLSRRHRLRTIRGGICCIVTSYSERYFWKSNQKEKGIFSCLPKLFEVVVESGRQGGNNSGHDVSFGSLGLIRQAALFYGMFALSRLHSRSNRTDRGSKRGIAAGYRIRT